MIVSANSHTTTPRWLRLAVLLCVFALLPLGIARAGEPDYGAVGKRLIEAVKAGELTADQAEAMMGELARSRFAERLHHAGRDRSGSDGARTLVGHYQRLGIDAKGLGRIKAALREGGLDDKRMGRVLGAMLRIVHELKSEGEQFELDPGMRRYLRADLRLAYEQIDRVVGMSRRILHVARTKAADGDGGARLRAAAEEIRTAFEAGRITQEEAATKLEVLRKKAAHAEHEHGREHTRGGEVRSTFKRLGLDDDAIDAVRKSLKESELTDEQVEKTMRGMFRVAHGMKAKGEAFELDARLRSYFLEGVGLSEAQLDRVLRLTRRIAAAMQGGDR